MKQIAIAIIGLMAIIGCNTNAQGDVCSSLSRMDYFYKCQSENNEINCILDSPMVGDMQCTPNGLQEIPRIRCVGSTEQDARNNCEIDNSLPVVMIDWQVGYLFVADAFLKKEHTMHLKKLKEYAHIVKKKH